MTDKPKPEPSPAPQSQPLVPAVVQKRGTAVRALDDRKKAEICALIALGVSRTRTAMAVGCHRDTILRTMRREPAFAEQMRKAETQQEIALLARIEEASKHIATWKAAAWLLDRRYPDRYGSRRPGTMTRSQVGTVIAQMSDILTRRIRDPKDRRAVGAELKLLVTALTGETEGK